MNDDASIRIINPDFSFDILLMLCR